MYTMAIEYFQVYHDSLAELDTQASSAIPSMKSAIFGRLALQYDQLLEDLEGEDRSYYSSILPFFQPSSPIRLCADREVFSDVEDDLTSRGIDVESICNNSRILSRPVRTHTNILIQILWS